MITVVDSSHAAPTELGWELVGETSGLPVCVISVDAPPGGGPSLHRHPYPELFFILEGEATFTDGSERVVVHAGQVVCVDADHPHSFVNSGTGRLRQLDVHLNARFETEWL